MTTVTDKPQLIFIPLNQLKKSPDNIRKTKHTSAHISALAANIDALGIIQNLLVTTEVDRDGQPTGKYAVTAGEGRRLAQLLRVKQGKITAEEPIPCLVNDNDDQTAMSLSENQLRELKIHPADQFEAFKRMIDSGKSIGETAATFSVTPRVVQSLLKLANIAPEFITAYRAGKVKLEELMALAITDEHDKQRHVWNSLPEHERHAQSLRRALTQDEISANDPIVKFVGYSAYKKAGGQSRNDLFAQEDEFFLLEVDLVKDMARQKLQKVADKLKKEGRAWVMVTLEVDYSDLAAFKRVQWVEREATEDERVRRKALYEQLNGLQEKIEESGEEVEEGSEIEIEYTKVSEAINQLEESLREIDREQKGFAGALVSIDRYGALWIEDGLLKPEDAKRLKRAQPNSHGEAESGGTARVHSAALTRQLTAHKTLAIQARIAQCPSVALVALTHHLVLKTFFKSAASLQSIVQVDSKAVQFGPLGQDFEQSPAGRTLAGCVQGLLRDLPTEGSLLFAWLMQQSQEKVLSLLAYCVAVTIDGVSDVENCPALDELAVATGLDMNDFWQPSAVNYFGRVSKARILAVLEEVLSGEPTVALRKLNRTALAQSAERLLADRKWLPSVLRTRAA